MSNSRLAGGVVEQLHLPGAVGIPGPLLLQHLDHHVVRGLVDEGDQHLLAVRCRGPSAFCPLAASETSQTKSQVSVSGRV